MTVNQTNLALNHSNQVIAIEVAADYLAISGPVIQKAPYWQKSPQGVL